MKKNKNSKNWIKAQQKDPYIKASKEQGYRSRSAFKLIEMDKKFKFLNKNSYLLDLGSSPGGWSQVATKKITQGKILAIDIEPMNKIHNVEFMQGDLLNSDRRLDELLQMATNRTKATFLEVDIFQQIILHL